ncbi:hypothetical protein VTH06DRAFT_4227 [Thermothelomyces fergusii]
MEAPPAKRPRFGPAPFEDPDYDDPEADELNEQPEAVNARRDPAARLERSRAFAALKLKSAFERIFEKYGHDFTGVADEIDLRTGEIVVDNGHIQSLKDARLGGSDGSDAEGSDGAADAPASLDEEDRMLRGTRVESRLSQVGLTAMPSASPRPGAATPFSTRGWPGPSPGLSSMTTAHPDQVPFGERLVQYGTPISVPATDPVWRAPDLPVLPARNGPASGGLTGSVRKKVARLSLSAARDQGSDEEDDILLGSPALEKEKENIDGLAVKQKVLQPRTPQEKTPCRGRGRKSVERQVTRSGKSPKSAKALAKTSGNKAAAVGRTPPTGPARGAKSPREARGRRPAPKDAAAGTPATPTPAKARDESPAPSVLGPPGAASNGARESLPGARESMSGQPGAQVQMGAGPDLYVSFSGEQGRLAQKPRNQILRVEIAAKTAPGSQAFRIMTPEATDEDSRAIHTDAPDISDPQTDPARSDTRDADLPDPGGHTVVRDQNTDQTASGEVFSRNQVDPAYAFSDEDEPTLPKKAPKLDLTNGHEIFRHGTLPETRSQTDTAVASSSDEPGGDDVAQELGGSLGMREQSPTLSLIARRELRGDNAP